MKGVRKVNSKTENLYKILKSQTDKIAKHNRQGSYKTKERYADAVNRFNKHIAEKFGIQKFENIQDKHLESYIKSLQEKDRSAGYIKTDLSAIRFFHDKCSDPRYSLSDNSKFELERRHFGGVNRSWSDKEYQSFLKLAEQRQNQRIADIAVLARNMGLRLHETLRIDKAMAANAVKAGVLHIKGKGGKERDVTINQEVRELFSARLKITDQGQKLFVNECEKTHLVIKQVQNFINRNRELFQDREPIKSTSNVPVLENITFHGLRHSFAAEKYNGFIEAGKSEYEARLAVSQLLGHERDDVTKIYTP
jgi:integrase/recombinase XerD